MIGQGWIKNRRSCRGLMAALFLLLAAAVFPFPAWALESGGELRVDDSAGLFSDGQEEALEAQAAALREEMNMDVAVVTADSTGGLATEEYADSYYEAGGFGIGKSHSGMLILLDMGNRQIYVSTEGAMIRFLTDARTETMMDHAMPYMQEGDYAGAVGQILADTQIFYRKGIPGGQYNYDRDTGQVRHHRSIRWYEGLIAFAVAAFCGGSACLAVRKEYAMEKERQQAANYQMAYRANAAFQYHSQNDVLADKSVSQALIARAVSGGMRPGGYGGGTGGGRSTTHTSGGGRTHGGGGRKF